MCVWGGGGLTLLMTCVMIVVQVHLYNSRLGSGIITILLVVQTIYDS